MIQSNNSIVKNSKHFQIIYLDVLYNHQLSMENYFYQNAIKITNPFLMPEGKRGVQGQILDFLYFFTVKFSTLDGIITFTE